MCSRLWFDPGCFEKKKKQGNRKQDPGYRILTYCQQGTILTEPVRNLRFGILFYGYLAKMPNIVVVGHVFPRSIM